VSGVFRWVAVLALAAAIVAFGARPLRAWWFDDVGNLAYARGDLDAARLSFDRGLALEPSWHVLLEDRGRAELDRDPGSALADLLAADCGSPCVAEEGDAQSRLGRPQAAVDDYLAAHAVDRVAAAAERLAALHHFDEAIALEADLTQTLGTGMLVQADLAASYAELGGLNARAAAATPARAKRYGHAAIDAYRRAAALAPFNEGYLLSLGFADLQWGDRRGARAAFERVLDLHPRETDAERGLARLGSAGSAGP